MTAECWCEYVDIGVGWQSECPHAPADQYVLRPGRLACAHCGRVINHPAAQQRERSEPS